ncbi:MAG: hypothetical protein O2872_00545 [Actinomycetota bacterium]|nr:hypothetical protein [Actinomycetota bacterium]
MKKVLSLSLILLLVFPNTASAVSIKSAKTLFELPYLANDQVRDVLLKNNNIFLTGTTESINSIWIPGQLNGSSDGFVTSYSTSGVQNWSLRLGSEGNEIATALTADQDGSIWVVGASNTYLSQVTPINPPNILNPDNVPITPAPQTPTPINKIRIWQISSAGVIINSFEYSTDAVVLPNNIFVSNDNLVVFGNIYKKSLTKGFYISSSKTGVFSGIIKIGKKFTQINSAIINKDSSFTAVGSSSDKILKTKPIGKADAITLRISDLGLVQQVARATLKSTSRSWDSIGSGLFQGGRVNYSNKSEAAITKFSALSKPVWNVRYLSKSSTLVAAGKNSWASFVSTGAIKGIPKWKPKVATPVVLEFGKKGKIISSYTLSAPAVAIDINSEIGTVLITDSGKSFGLVLINQ